MSHRLTHRLTRLAPRRRTTLAVALAAGALGSLLGGGSAQAASSLPAFPITVSPTAITLGPAPQSGAVNVVVGATGKVKEGSLILFALKPGAAIPEVEAYLAEKKHAGDPNYADRFGSLVLDEEATTGSTNEAQTYLQPGQYLALAAPGEGPPTIHTTFTVAAAKAPVALPPPEATIRSIEFNFRGPTTIHDGELVRFENEGFLVHMDVAAKAKNMSAARKLVKDFRAGNEKAADKLITGFASFTGPLSPGAYQQETINAKPGVYVQLCFMQTQDGRDHTLLGMERIIRITK